MFLSKKFLLDTLERGLSTAAEAVLLALGGDAVNVLSLDYQILAGAAGGGFLVAVLKSVAARGVGSSDSAALLPESAQ